MRGLKDESLALIGKGGQWKEREAILATTFGVACQTYSALEGGGMDLQPLNGLQWLRRFGYALVGKDDRSRSLVLWFQIFTADILQWKQKHLKPSGDK